MSELNALDIDKLRTRTGEKWSLYNDDVIPAWVADMDFEIAAPIRDAVVERLNRFDCGYPRSAAKTGLPEIFAERVQNNFGWHINPDQVDLFNDVVQAIYFGLLALSEPGDGVIIQTPIYPPFISSTEETHRRVIACPLVPKETRYEIDFEQLGEAAKCGGKILLFCNPHNPSGRSFDESELTKLAEFALAHSLWVISDEIHAELVLDKRMHIPIASLDDEIAERTVTLMSASKAFNIAGICMAFAVYGGNAIREAFGAGLPQHFRGGVNALSISAVTAAFTQSDAWLAGVIKQLRENRQRLFEQVNNDWSPMKMFMPEATYLAWLDCSELELKPDPYRFFLGNAKVALGEGIRFGEQSGNFARLNFATSPAILGEIIGRMDRALRQAGQL